MGEFIAYVGLFVFLGGLVGMVSPRLLRLRRRMHALAVVVAGFFLIGFGASRDPEMQQQADQVPSQAADAAEVSEATWTRRPPPTAQAAAWRRPSFVPPTNVGS